ncbi:MAG: DUF4783 domain-containing protein [Bacteroidales bacterium]|nr:DUF4783 domain-containing protein [Bacteroidales bacterium]
MKRLIYILVVGLVIMLCSYSLLGRGEDVSKKINQAICLGQSGVVAEHLASEVAFKMYGSESTCTKGEVEQVLREFFSHNRPSQFLCTTGTGIITGKLTTSNGKSYKIEYMLKNVDNKEVITGFYLN